MFSPDKYIFLGSLSRYSFRKPNDCDFADIEGVKQIKPRKPRGILYKTLPCAGKQRQALLGGNILYTQALHTYRINLSPFTKDFRVWGAPIETKPIYLWLS